MRRLGSVGVLAPVMALVVSGCGYVTIGNQSAGEYPARRIELIVPFAAGGGTDSLARLWAGCMEEELDQTITVVNQAGGASAVGGLFVADSEPDGYTMSISTATSYAIVPAVEPDVGYTYEDFQMVGMVGLAPDVIYVAADSPLETIDDYLAAAVDKSRTLKVAGYVPTTSSRFRPEEFEYNNGVTWETIPYPTSNDIVLSVMGGSAEAGYDYLSLPLVEQVRAGEIRVLAAGMDISAAIQNVPTFEELGLQGFSGPNAATFFLHGPAGLPDDAVAVWEGAVNACRGSDYTANNLIVQTLPDEITGPSIIELAAQEAAAYQNYIDTLYPPN